MGLGGELNKIIKKKMYGWGDGDFGGRGLYVKC